MISSLSPHNIPLYIILQLYFFTQKCRSSSINNSHILFSKKKVFMFYGHMKIKMSKKNKSNNQFERKEKKVHTINSSPWLTLYYILFPSLVNVLPSLYGIWQVGCEFFCSYLILYWALKYWRSWNRIWIL